MALILTVLSTPGSTSCKKAFKWLDERNIPYYKRNVICNPLKREEFHYLLQRTDNGVYDLLSTRSIEFKLIESYFDSLSISEVYDLIKDKPNLLKTPILIDSNNLEIGFNIEGIRCFIPRKDRRFSTINI